MKARFELRNLVDTPLGVRAVPSYAPSSAVRYVEKVQCFCFDAIHLAPREVREVTVVLVLKSDLPPTLGPSPCRTRCLVWMVASSRPQRPRNPSRRPQHDCSIQAVLAAFFWGAGAKERGSAKK